MLVNFEPVGIYFSNTPVGDPPTAFVPLFTHGPLVLSQLFSQVIRSIKVLLTSVHIDSAVASLS